MKHWWQLTPGEIARLNPPARRMLWQDDGLYERWVADDAWLNVGYIPCPQTRLGWFVYHVIHGLAMRYPIHKVLAFALLYRGDPDGE